VLKNLFTAVYNLRIEKYDRKQRSQPNVFRNTRAEFSLEEETFLMEQLLIA